MICPTCGTDVRDDQEACACCGARVRGKQAPAPVMVGEGSQTIVRVPQRWRPDADSPDPSIPVGTSGAVREVERAVRDGGLNASRVPASAPVAENAIPVEAIATDAAGVAAESKRPASAPSPFIQDEVRTRLTQAAIHIRRGRLEEARELIVSAKALDPESPSCREAMGELLEAEGDDIGAYREYQAAVIALPETAAEAHVRLARLTVRLPPSTLALLQPGRKPVEPSLPASVEALIPNEARVVLAKAEAARPLPAPTRHPGVAPFASLAVPGFGQAINGDYGKALIMFLVWLFCVVVLVVFLYPVAHSRHGGFSGAALTLNLADPVFMSAVAIAMVDYVTSIADAAIYSSRESGQQSGAQAWG